MANNTRNLLQVAKIYLAELMLIFDVLTTFVGTLSLPKALKEATSGRANTRMLTILFIPITSS